MPVHDWRKVGAGIFHAFHQSWCVAIQDALNDRVLQPPYYALVEQRVGGPEPDVVALKGFGGPESTNGGVAVAIPTKTKIVQRLTPDADHYARKADRIAIRHEMGELVALIEIVSPGNKSAPSALRAFVEKVADFVLRGVHVLVVDLFPPSARDPNGIHAAIAAELGDGQFELSPDKPLTLASYQASPEVIAHVEPLAVGDDMLAMPLFLTGRYSVATPLQTTYDDTWKRCPKPIRGLVEAS